MFKQLIKKQKVKSRAALNQRAQNTAEYALLIALVIAGVIAMQTYAQRSLQARTRDAGVFMQGELKKINSTMGESSQYEPYYSKSSYDVSRNSVSNKRLDSTTTAFDSNTARVREAGGYEESGYDSKIFTNKI